MEVCKNIEEKVIETFEETIEKWIEKVDEVCEDLPWPIDWFCHAVTSLIKIVETVVKEVVRIYIKVVCTPIAFVFTVLTGLLQLALAIPILGTWIRFLVGSIVWLWSQFIGLVDAVGGLVGLRPIKHLRLEVFILMHPDGTLTVQPGATSTLLASTESIFRSRADVKVHTTIHQVDSPSPGNALTIGTEIDPLFGLLAEDATGAGMYFQKVIHDRLWQDSPWLTFRLGATIILFVVDEVEGTYAGCSAGPIVDYICIEGRQFGAADQTLIAHEMGHACGLFHDDVTDCANGDLTNLMYCQATKNRQPRGNNLSPFQRALVRSSPHVTYV